MIRIDGRSLLRENTNARRLFSRDFSNESFFQTRDKRSASFTIRNIVLFYTPIYSELFLIRGVLGCGNNCDILIYIITRFNSVTSILISDKV